MVSGGQSWICRTSAPALPAGEIRVGKFGGVPGLVGYLQARRIERVTITARDVVVTHEAPNWRHVVWESPTAFTRVNVEREEDRALGLRLALSGREVSVAQALSPRERGEFAKALEHAIWEARRERG